MSEHEKKHRIGDGLPCCIGKDADGFKRLNSKLGLLNRGQLRSLLKSDFVREQTHTLHKTLIDKRPRPRASDRDRLLLFGFYGDPNIRRSLWIQAYHHTEIGESKDRIGIYPIPSLEHRILAKYMQDHSTRKDDIVGIDGIFGKWPDLVQYLKEDIPWANLAAHIWSDIQEDLDSWDVLNKEKRSQTTLITFAVATIVDDQRILLAAVRKVPELKTEFDNVLNDGDDYEIIDEPVEEEDVLLRWNDLCVLLKHLAGKSAGPPLVVDTLAEITDVVAELEEIEPSVREHLAISSFDNLMSCLGEFFEDLEADPVFFWIDGRVRGQLRARWQEARQSHFPGDVREEIDRLSAKVPIEIESVRKIATTLSDASHRIASLRSEEPIDFASHHSWEETLDELEEQNRILRRKQRQAQIALLSQLSPSGATFDPSQDYSISPPPPQTLPQGRSESLDSAAEMESLLSAPARKSDEKSDVPQASDTDGKQPMEVEIPAVPDAAIDDTAPVNRKPLTEDESELKSAPLLIPSRPSETKRPESGGGDTAVDPLSGLASARIVGMLFESPPRIAYAVQVGRLIDCLDIITDQPPVVLFEAALLSDHLRLSDGAVASKLKRTFEQFPPPEQFSDGPERDRYVMLGLAGTLRPALLAPQSGALVFLSALKPSERLSSVYQFAHTIAEESQKLQGVRINSAVLKGIGSETIWKGEHERLCRDANEWKTHALHRTIKYAPATKVWQRWLRSEGLINRLVEHVVSGENNKGDTFVRDIAVKLEDRKIFENLVRNTDRMEIGRRRGEDIHAGALDQLHTHALEAVALARRHLNLGSSRPSQSDFLIRALTEIRSKVDTLSPSALEELRNIVNEEQQLFSAAANVAAYAIDRFRQFFDPQHTDMEWESDPKDLIASGLFGFPSLHIEDDGTPEGDPRQVLDALVSTEQPEELESAFSKILESGDLGAAKRIVCWIENEELNDTDEFRRRLDKQFQSETQRLHHEIIEIRTRVEIALVRGYISDAERATHDAVLVELERHLAESKVYRFDLERIKLDTIIEKINAGLKVQQRKAESKLANLSLSRDSTEYKEIFRSITQGDIVTANELMDRINSSESMPIHETRTDKERQIFDEFYPVRSRAIEQALEDAGNNPMRIMTKIEKDAEFAGMTLTSVPGAQRRSAVQMLGAWFTLKRAGSLSEQTSDKNITTLFSGLGFIVRKVTIGRSDRNLGEARIDTDPVHTRERCPIPAFGSFANGQYRLVFLWGRPTEEDILQHADESNRKRATIILFFGRLNETTREALAHIARERFRTLLVLDELLLMYLCGERGSRMPVLFASTLPFTYVQPYVTTAGAVPPEMFYGREREIRDITDLNGSVFIYGGRQLGKTALLRAAERISHRPEDGSYAVWLDLKGVGIGYDRDAASIWPAIWQALRDRSVIPDNTKEPNPNIRGRIDDFVNYLCSRFSSPSSNALFLLLDEADRFLEIDARDSGSAAEGFRESSRLKTLMDRTGRSIKVVFAGLHNVLRTVESANHPLGHFGQPIQIGPLLLDGGWRAAEALIRRPLLAAGYRFEQDALVTRILAQTNYYPSLIQLYGSALIREMCSKKVEKRSPLYNIDGRILDETYQNTNLREMIRSRFHLTLQLDPRYEVIAYAIANECVERDDLLGRGIDHRRIDDSVRDWWPDGFEDIEPYTDAFRSLLDEMVGLGVLRVMMEGRYTLRNPNVLLLMGTKEEIADNLLRDREPPQEFERELFRARDPRAPDGPARSPLTLRQEDLLRAERSRVSLICGLSASGFEDVLQFLKARGTNDSVEQFGDMIDHREFEEDLRRRERQRPEGSTIYVVPSTAPWSQNWIRIALDRIGNLRAKGRYMQIVFMANSRDLWQLMPELDWLNRRGVQWISLRPWRRSFLRQWMADMGFTNDPNMCERIDVNTGGWWIFLKRLYNLEQKTGNLEISLERLEEELNSEDIHRQLQSFGLDVPEIGNSLLYIAELGEVSFEDLRNFVDGEGVSDDTLRRKLSWAQLLHLVRRVGRDMWQMDPTVGRILMRASD